MSRIEDQIAMDDDYRRAALLHKIAMYRRAEKYARAFDEAYQRRMERRAADSRQFLEVILPAIKNEASLLRYEREIGKISGTVPGTVQ